MALRRMDNVALIVEDLPRMIAFFKELGMKLEGEMTVQGPWVDKCIGLKDVQCDIAMMRMPDGHGAIEMSRFRKPKAIAPTPAPKDAPVNVLGFRRVMFQVDDVDATVAHMRKHGGELLDEVVQYEDVYRLCYMRGPEGILIGLAQELGKRT